MAIGIGFNICYLDGEKQLLQLLMKASQDKKFVCEEAEKALNMMVNSLARLPLLRKLQTYVRHSNPRVRAKAAVSTSNCVSKMVCPILQNVLKWWEKMCMFLDCD